VERGALHGSFHQGWTVKVYVFCPVVMLLPPDVVAVTSKTAV
jgi:hypothetical protein